MTPEQEERARAMRADSIPYRDIAAELGVPMSLVHRAVHDVRTRYTADADATPLDRAVMALAQRMADAGWVDDADELAANAAYLRETPKSGGMSPREVRDALEDIAANAAGAVHVIGKAFPDEIALRHGGE